MAEFVDYDEADLERGVSRLEGCRGFDEFATEMLVDHHLRANFPGVFLPPINIDPLPMRDISTVWPLEPWLLVARKGALHAVRDPDEAPIALPTIGGLNLVEARDGIAIAADQTTLHGPVAVPFDDPAGIRREDRFDSKVDYVRFAVRVPTEPPKDVVSLGAMGRFTDVDIHDGEVFIVVSAPLRADRGVVSAARRRVADAKTPEELRSQLPPLAIKSGAETTPQLTVSATNLGKTLASQTTTGDCNHAWIPNDRRAQVGEVLAAFRYDPRKRRIEESMLVGGGSVVARFHRGVLYVARALRGSRLDQGRERPLTQIETYSMLDKPTLSNVSEIEAIPIDFTFAGDEHWLLAASTPGLDHMRVRLDRGKPTGEPERREGDVSVANVVGELPFPPGDALFAEELIAGVGDELVFGSLTDGRVVLRRRAGPDAAAVSAGTSPEGVTVIKWRPEDASQAGNVLVVPAVTLDGDEKEQSGLRFVIEDDAIDVTAVGDRGELGLMATPDGVVTASTEGIRWLDAAGKEIRAVRWKDRVRQEIRRKVRRAERERKGSAR